MAERGSPNYTKCACCAAGRSGIPLGACAAPAVTGAFRAIGATTSVFGWCPPAFESLRRPVRFLDVSKLPGIGSLEDWTGTAILTRFGCAPGFVPVLACGTMPRRPATVRPSPTLARRKEDSCQPPSHYNSTPSVTCSPPITRPASAKSPRSATPAWRPPDSPARPRRPQPGCFGELGLTVCSAHSPLPLGDKQAEVLDTMAALGCSRLVCPWKPQELFTSIDGIRQVCDELNEANIVAGSWTDAELSQPLG